MRILTFAIALFLSTSAVGQAQMSLSEAVDLAISNNMRLKQEQKLPVDFVMLTPDAIEGSKTIIQPISIDPKLKEIAQKKSEEIFGTVNLSGYIRYLILKDSKEPQK